MPFSKKSTTVLTPAPVNVLLTKGEANLKKSSVVNISQLITVDKSDLIEKIGVLSPDRITQII
ncbi:MAG: type II toxin-antitoxin system PemK/MazF family toxin, partial [Candidatus Scalindua sp.]